MLTLLYSNHLGAHLGIECDALLIEHEMPREQTMSSWGMNHLHRQIASATPGDQRRLTRRVGAGTD